LQKNLPLSVGLVLAVAAAASMWLYTQWILKPAQVADAAAHDRPRGNLSDLYPRWLGARELLLRGRDPYAADITREIQTGYYGRPIDASRPDDPKDQQGFAYPVYVVFVLAPTVKLPFAVVQKVFVMLLVLLTGWSVPLWARALGWRLSLPVSVSWIILVSGCFPAIQGFRLQQLTLLVAALLALALCTLAESHFALAGVLLAVAAIKPQLAALPIAVLCIWSLGNLRERQRLLWGMGITMFLLVAGGEVLLPGWISKFRAASADYWRYTGGGRSVLDVELTPALGRIISALLVAVLFYFAWRLRQAEARSRDFGWLLALTLATTLMVIPMFAPYNQVLLLPVFIVIARGIRPLWASGRVSRFFVVAVALTVLWPWLAAAGLLAALIFAPAPVVQRGWALPLFTNFAIPTVTLGLVLIGRKALRSVEGQNR
jgi:Glycosyltransferase family 87